MDLLISSCSLKQRVQLPLLAAIQRWWKLWPHLNSWMAWCLSHLLRKGIVHFWQLRRCATHPRIYRKKLKIKYNCK